MNIEKTVEFSNLTFNSFIFIVVPVQVAVTKISHFRIGRNRSSRDKIIFWDLKKIQTQKNVIHSWAIPTLIKYKSTVKKYIKINVCLLQTCILLWTKSSAGTAAGGSGLYTANMWADVSVVTKLLVIDAVDSSEEVYLCFLFGVYILVFLIGSLYSAGFP